MKTLALPERVEERLAVPEALGKFGVTFLGARLNPGVEVYDTMVYDRDAWPEGAPGYWQRERVRRFFHELTYTWLWAENRVNMDAFFWSVVNETELKEAKAAWPSRPERVCQTAWGIVMTLGMIHSVA